MSSGGLARWARGNAVGLLALFVALGGTGIATVGSQRGGSGSASQKGIHAKASKAQLNNRTQGLQQQIDALLGQIANLQGQRGIPGPQGIPGPAGATGMTGPAGVPGSPAASASFGRINNVTTNAFGGAIGFTDATNTESDVTVASPNAPILARDLFVEVTVPPGPGDAWQVFLLDDSIFTDVFCTISDSDTTCNSEFTALIGAGSRLSIAMSALGLGPATTDVLFGWRATTP